MKFEKIRETRKESITVGFLFEAIKDKLHLSAVTGEVGLHKEIFDEHIHRPGLALAGYVELFTYNRVQIFGNTEVRFLKQLTPEERTLSLKRIFQFDLPCVIVTSDNPVDEILLSLALEHQVAVFRSPVETTRLLYFISDFLDDQFAVQSVVHGSLVDVYGVGLLITGRSGIGKSEVALDLIERGHRLVADDVVNITRKGEGILMGAGTDLVKHFMEIRGLGLIDIRSMFGIRAIRFQKRVEILVELMEWRPDEEYTRTGLDNDTIPVLNVTLPHVKLPIFPGKNVTVICEVISLNYLLKHYGYDAAKEFSKRLESVISEKNGHIQTRAIDSFEHDFE